MSIYGARPNNLLISPHVIVRGEERAVAFYERAFGAQVLYRSPMPDGQGIHAQLRIHNSVVLVSDESNRHPDWRLHSLQSLGGICAILELYVDDADAAFARAVGAGSRADDEAFRQLLWRSLELGYGPCWALASVQQ